MIKKLMKCEGFNELLNGDEKEAWKKIKEVTKNFLGNKRATNHKEMIAEMMSALKVIKVNMSPKMHYLDGHVERFEKNCGDFSDEQGERFHQDIVEFERRYKGKSIINMLGEYCWSLCRYPEEEESKRICKQPSF